MRISSRKGCVSCMKNKMGAVGPKDAVLAFRALGIEVIPVETPEETSQAVFRLAQQGYAVIFITEQEAASIPETLDRYKSQPLPAIIPIPGSQGAIGYGMAALNANVEKAVGANILFQKEG